MFVRRLMLALGVLSVGSVGAMAADMPLKAPPVAPPVLYNWTGFYVGLNGGGTWVRDHLTSDPADAGTTAFWAGCFAAGTCPRDYGTGSVGTGGEFGGQAGYNWQIQNFLIGVEGDIQWARATSSSAVALANTGTGFVPFNGQASSRLDWFGTARVRFGALITPSWLLYGTGGLAFGEINRTWTANFPITGQLVSGADTHTDIGWVVGAGLEWMFAPHWVLGAEYLYMRFKSDTFSATGLGSAGCTATDCNFTVSSSGLSASVARARLSYKF